MKQQPFTVSPFIVLLAPVLLIIALLVFNERTEEETEKFQASQCLRVPAIRGLIQATFNQTGR